MVSGIRYPSVYIEESPFGVAPISGVATSVAGFVGFTPKGPAGRPLRVTSLADYVGHFGQPKAADPIALAVQLFFENGGREAYIVRVASAGSARAKRPTARPLIACLHALNELETLNLLVVPDTAAL